MAEKSESMESLRQFFKSFNQFMLFMWRLGLGQWVNVWPAGIGRIMVITHTGRKTGLRRQTPVNYTLEDGEIYCVAGFGQTSDWYRNLQAHPNVEVWLPDGWWSAIAETLTDTTRRIPLIRQVIIYSGFAGRLAGMNPQTMTDQEIDQATSDYRLVHIHREQARTGPGGPGDLAWVWPLLTVILFPLAFRRRRKR